MNFCPIGDLTDAKNIDTLGSRQYEDEWKLYRNTLDKFDVAKKTIWLDVRGNHGKKNLLVLKNRFVQFTEASSVLCL